MLRVIVLSIAMLGVVMLSVVPVHIRMLSVVAPKNKLVRLTKATVPVLVCSLRLR